MKNLLSVRLRIKANDPQEEIIKTVKSVIDKVYFVEFIVDNGQSHRPTIDKNGSCDPDHMEPAIYTLYLEAGYEVIGLDALLNALRMEQGHSKRIGYWMRYMSSLRENQVYVHYQVCVVRNRKDLRMTDGHWVCSDPRADLFSIELLKIDCSLRGTTIKSPPDVGRLSSQPRNNIKFELKWINHIIERNMIKSLPMVNNS